MKQIYHNYELWEDYQARMYDSPCLDSLEAKITSEEKIQKAKECLSNPKICDEYMKKVIDNWKYACEQVLTDKALNRKAWLGWSACCLYANCKQEETCSAWWLLTEKERIRANKIAQKHINLYEKNNNDNDYEQMSIEWRN